MPEFALGPALLLPVADPSEPAAAAVVVAADAAASGYFLDCRPNPMRRRYRTCTRY